MDGTVFGHTIGFLKWDDGPDGRPTMEVVKTGYSHNYPTTKSTHSDLFTLTLLRKGWFHIIVNDPSESKTTELFM